MSRNNYLNLNEPRENKESPLKYISPFKFKKLIQDKVERENVQHSPLKNDDQRQKTENHSSTDELLKHNSQFYNDKQKRESS